MNVACLELCKRLFERSGWDESEHDYYEVYDDRQNKTQLDAKSMCECEMAESTLCIGNLICPAYDLGYLLQKLPKSVTTFWGEAYPASPCLMYSGTQWVIFYQSEMSGEHNTDELFGQFADTPEDAACLIALELFQQGVLKRA